MKYINSGFLLNPIKEIPILFTKSSFYYVPLDIKKRVSILYNYVRGIGDKKDIIVFIPIDTILGNFFKEVYQKRLLIDDRYFNFSNIILWNDYYEENILRR